MAESGVEDQEDAFEGLGEIGFCKKWE